MRIFGMGIPEMAMIIIPTVVILLIAYFIIRQAVKSGVKKALEERDEGNNV